MALLNLILIVELVIMACSTRTIFKGMTVWNIYCIIYDLYAALHDHSFFAMLFIALINSIYVFSVVKVFLKPESLSRRKLLITSVNLSYTVRLMCDMWTVINMKPEIASACEAGLSQNPAIIDRIVESFEMLEFEEAWNLGL